jgi:ribosomal protein S11
MKKELLSNLYKDFKTESLANSLNFHSVFKNLLKNNLVIKKNNPLSKISPLLLTTKDKFFENSLIKTEHNLKRNLFNFRENLNNYLKFFSKYKKEMVSSHLRFRKNKRKKIKIYFKKGRKKSYLFKFKYQLLKALKTDSFQKLSIRVTSNNIFCTLSNLKNNKIKLLGYAGKYSLNISRKKLRYSFKVLLDNFFEEIRKKNLITKKVLISIIAPLKLRKRFVKFLTPFLKKKNVILNVEDKKCFNGCRPSKKRRKKRKGLRLFR